MALTTERAEKLAQYLTADTTRAKALVELSADEAVAKINADGFDFTVEEMKDFAAQMQKVAEAQGSSNGELDEKSLEDVSGGIVVAACIVGAGVTLFTAGVTFGYTVARDRGW